MGVLSIDLAILSLQKKISSLTFISMTHITIKTIRHIVSETQTDRQRQFIIRYIYLLEILLAMLADF